MTITQRSANARPADYVHATCIGRLNHEWSSTLAHTPAPWQLPTDSTVETLQQALEAISDATDPDPLLHRLLQLHHDGDAAAGRLLLQTMLGSAHRLSRTARGRGLADGEADAVAAMWTAIATYPLHRTQRVAANLALEALAALQKALSIDLPASDDLEDLAHWEQSCGRLSGTHGPSASEEAAEALLWALDHRVLTKDEVALLTSIYITSDRATSADLAQIHRLSPAALRQRQHRAVRKLATAVRAEHGTADAA